MKANNYSVKKELHRIADSLELKNIQLELIYHSLCEMNDAYSESARRLREQIRTEYSVVKSGLSNICRNVYAENIRTQELLDLLKEHFPEDKGLKERRIGNA